MPLEATMPMVTVLVDGIHVGQEMKGVGRYVLNAVAALCAIEDDVHYAVLLLRGANGDLASWGERTHPVEVPWRNHLWHGFVALPAQVARLRPDVVWVPYETAVGPLGRPFAILCHDVPSRIREAQGLAGAERGALARRLLARLDDLLLSWTLRRARIVFANSAYVASWIEKTVGVEASRIRHAPCAPGADFRRMSQRVDKEEVWRRLGTPHGYILAVFTGDMRENFAVVPRIYDRLVQAGLPQSLVVAGVREGERVLVESALSRYAWRQRAVIVRFLPAGREQELAELYAAALAYVDPSLHEGFGMQVIEAMACGTPVVCSDRGALPEVAGDAAVLVDPEDPAGIAEAVVRVFEDRGLRERLVARGEERAASFTWERTARVIREGLMQVAGGF